MAVEFVTVPDFSDVERKILADLIGADEYAQVVKMAFGVDGTLTLVTPTVKLPVTESAIAAIVAAGRAQVNPIVAQAGLAANEGVPSATVLRNIPAVNQMDGGGDAAPPINSVNVITNSAAISCENKRYIVLGTEYSDSAGTVPIVVFLLDHNGSQKSFAVGPATPGNLGFQGFTIETNYYSGDTLIIETKGAKEFKIRVNAVPSAGFVSVFAAVV